MSKIFMHPYRVRIIDINYGGHMGNDRALGLFHEARIFFLKSKGFTEMDIGGGLGIIQKDAYVDYLAEVFHGDELEIYVKPGKRKGLLFYLDYEVLRKADQKKVLKGQTALLAFNYKTRKLAKTPDSFLQKLDENNDH
jgi:acyl-CoA thioester hydrolase